ncbi:MAG: M23 family metallopeptidase [Microbacterium sp.]|nr:M23 family metallopeptidase [Microbacterium sp.]MBN9191855.1 M23 family metallopeptidase [Microbacterium sp.]MBN9608113.1 M23 family metallopeptidase [Actinomycetota bacterium]
MKKLAAGFVALVLAGPAALMLMVAVLANPSAVAACTTGTLNVGPVPDSLTATTKDGTTVTLDKTQLTHAATIVTVAGQVNGVGRPGAVIAIMAALTESSLRMLANTSAYPDSASYPNDGNGGDHDSLGMFQMRPQSGWGTVAQLMDPVYQAKAFFGGPTGPNYPSPRGLLDIPGWQSMDPGQAAQSVEVSAYPDRYQNYQPVAEAIITALTQAGDNGAGGGSPAPSDLPAATQIVFPLPEGTWVKTSPFGPRVDPITGAQGFHTGTDYAAPLGTPILAIAAGQVTVAGPAAGYGNLIVIEHNIGGQVVASAYGHEERLYVKVGDLVTAGQHIADVGTEGHSTGPHLHFEIRPGGTNATAVDSDAWLKAHDAQGISGADATPALCSAGGGEGSS